MTGITREKAAQVAAAFLGGESQYRGTHYRTYIAGDAQGREWKFTYDGSIQPQKKENRRLVSASDDYKTELVSPICTGCAGASCVFVRFAYSPGRRNGSMAPANLTTPRTATTQSACSRLRASETSDSANCLGRSPQQGGLAL